MLSFFDEDTMPSAHDRINVLARHMHGTRLRDASDDNSNDIERCDTLSGSGNGAT